MKYDKYDTTAKLNVAACENERDSFIPLIVPLIEFDEPVHPRNRMVLMTGKSILA